MKLTDGMLLYHGSYVPVEKVDLSKCDAGKDFGRGFYLTAYLNGLYGEVSKERSAQMAISLLLPNRLKEQYCFLTQRVIDCLETVEVQRYELSTKKLLRGYHFD